MYCLGLQSLVAHPCPLRQNMVFRAGAFTSMSPFSAFRPSKLTLGAGHLKTSQSLSKGFSQRKGKCS